jgi:translation initiation factor 2 subunit 2
VGDEFGKKKKKKGGDDDDEAGEEEEEEAAGEATKTGSGLPWDGTNRDYHYDELLVGLYKSKSVDDP